ncbi:MAG: hypothetical protein AB7Q17_17995 [Phycisphaerae bacterium]
MTMKRIATTVRCVPRLGLESTEVRAVDLDLPEGAEPHEVHEALDRFFTQRGIAEAVYDIEADDNGFFAVVNDEIYGEEWGKPLF